MRLVMTSSGRDIIVTQRMFPTQSACKDQYLDGTFSYSNAARKANDRVLSCEQLKEKSKHQIEHSFVGVEFL
jgi:hypothetical protein